MKYMGEDVIVYRRSDTLRCFLLKVETVYGHSSGESLKWAPKVHGCKSLSLRPMDRVITIYERESLVSFYTRVLILYILWLFYLLRIERSFYSKRGDEKC
jgi:hypothetical protein